MSKLPMMPVFVPDLLADTYRLTNEEFGAYMRLLLVSWQAKGQPLSEQEAVDACKMTIAQFTKRLRHKLAGYFDKHELALGRWVQPRLVEEWALAEERASKSRKNGSRGGRPPKQETQEEPSGFPRTEGSGNPEQNPAIPIAIPTPTNPEPLPSVARALEVLDPTGKIKKFRDRSEVSGSGRWGNQRERDEYAVAQCVPHLPGRDDGERWAVAMAAEDPADPGHAGAVMAMREAAKAAGVGWVSPERRRGAA